MKRKKIALYETHEIRQAEQLAASLNLDSDTLMLRAAKAAFSLIKKLYPSAKSIAVFCGSGNNGGDGYVLARLLKNAGYFVQINQYKTAEKLKDSARQAAIEAIAAQVAIQELDDPIDAETDLIVDALLGIGLKGEVSGALLMAINQINDALLPVLSLDVPSGLDADTGESLSATVKASQTITFIGRKIGLLTLDGVDYCGELFCDDLELGSCLDSIKPKAYLLDDSLNDLLKPRLKNSHKGHFGHLLVIGGNYGMPGSICLSAEAAFRVGVGAVTIATTSLYAGQVLANLPEAMIYGIDETKDLDTLLQRATVCLIGPGLGEDEWAKSTFNHVLSAQLPMVIDASALRLLANNAQHDDNWILTPHPGEAAALLNCTKDEVQANRTEALVNLQDRYGGSIILKGAGSMVIGVDGKKYLCDRGNPGMATAGMGDVLSGVIAGLLAQKISLDEAAQLGVYLHARAGDLAASTLGERGLKASDLMPYLHFLANNRG
ncbi:MAG: NAD(P)H-hydrate dehydratase [Proteobacteria bacterium]|nr:NAD(P)H-hydrate dehydratase [Pseudomonadota bacterium]